MHEETIQLQLWEIRTDVYGAYNRYAIGWSEEYGTVHGCFRDTDCALPLGDYRNQVVSARVGVFVSGTVLIAAVGPA